MIINIDPENHQFLVETNFLDPYLAGSMLIYQRVSWKQMGEIGGYTGIYWEMMGYDRNYRTI